MPEHIDNHYWSASKTARFGGVYASAAVRAFQRLEAACAELERFPAVTFYNLQVKIHT
jgi:hypothetical protein